MSHYFVEGGNIKSGWVGEWWGGVRLYLKSSAGLRCCNRMSNITILLINRIFQNMRIVIQDGCLTHFGGIREDNHTQNFFFFSNILSIFFLSKNYCVKGKQAVYMNDALNITGTIKEIKKNLKIDLRKKFLFLMFISFFFLPDRNVLQRRLFINDALYLIDTIFPGRIVPC